MLDLQFNETLKQLGLNSQQASVYEVLLKNGPLPARKIVRILNLQRGLVYKNLEELQDLGLVERKDENGKVSDFYPLHPMRFRNILDYKKQSITNAENIFQGVIDTLSSQYNITINKPGIQYFEGKDGIRKTAFDSLNAKSEIYSYIDNVAVNKYIPEINKEYVKKRDRLGLPKKMITLDSEYIRKRAETFRRPVTDIRVVPGKFPFATVMMIYDNKVSYLTLDEKKMIGVIIEDSHIAKMHRSLFEFAWQSAKPLFFGSPIQTS